MPSVLWNAPDSNDPNNYREEYGPMGNIRRVYTGLRRPPVMLQPGGNTGVTGDLVQGIKSGGGPGFGGRIHGSTGPARSGMGPSNTVFGNYQQQPNTNITPIQQRAQQDYDRMMHLYEGLLNKTSSSTLRDRLQPMKAEQEQYEEDPRLAGSIGGLEELARTGGYTDEGIADLRERGLSPIRAIYANAQRNVERNKALQGGYSPNSNAVSAKMAREMSDLISGKTTDINAGIAEQVAKGRLQIAPQLTEALLNIQREKGGVGERNVGARNRASEFNKNLQLKQNELDASGRNQELEILNSMRSLFGTTPGLADTFIDQILKQGDQNQRGGSTLIDAYLRGVRG